MICGQVKVKHCDDIYLFLCVRKLCIIWSGNVFKMLLKKRKFSIECFSCNDFDLLVEIINIECWTFAWLAAMSSISISNPAPLIWFFLFKISVCFSSIDLRVTFTVSEVAFLAFLFEWKSHAGCGHVWMVIPMQKNLAAIKQ